jgi:hypothetical protein
MEMKSERIKYIPQKCLKNVRLMTAFETVPRPIFSVVSTRKGAALTNGLNAQAWKTA